MLAIGTRVITSAGDTGTIVNHIPARGGSYQQDVYRVRTPRGEHHYSETSLTLAPPEPPSKPVGTPEEAELLARWIDGQRETVEAWRSVRSEHCEAPHYLTALARLLGDAHAAAQDVRDAFRREERTAQEMSTPPRAFTEEGTR